MTKKYKFEGNVIKLNERDFNRWKAAYTHIDLVSELTALDDFYSQEKDVGKWFIRTSTALANKNGHYRQNKPPDEKREMRAERAGNNFDLGNVGLD